LKIKDLRRSFLNYQRNRNRGRPSAWWNDNIKKLAGNWMLMAQDRREWQSMREAFVQQWRQYRLMMMIFELMMKKPIKLDMW